MSHHIHLKIVKATVCPNCPWALVHSTAWRTLIVLCEVHKVSVALNKRLNFGTVVTGAWHDWKVAALNRDPSGLAMSCQSSTTITWWFWSTSQPASFAGPPDWSNLSATNPFPGFCLPGDRLPTWNFACEFLGVIFFPLLEGWHCPNGLSSEVLWNSWTWNSATFPEISWGTNSVPEVFARVSYLSLWMYFFVCICFFLVWQRGAFQKILAGSALWKSWWPMETGYNICQRALAPWFSWLFGSDEFITGGLRTRGLGCPPTLVDPINPTFFLYLC